MSLFHLITPSGYYTKQHVTLRGIQRLIDTGHQVNNVEVTVHRCERFADMETERLEDLNSLARLITPNTIVLAIRDGHGASCLLAGIDWQVLVAHQQHDSLLIYEHSDFIVTQCGLLTYDNVITFSDPMLMANLGADELNAFTEHHSWLTLRNETPAIEWQGEGPICRAEGTSWKGNLAMLISLTGIPWVPGIENGILVLEDADEHPFRVERMLLQFHHAGILPCQKAIIFGSFGGSTLNDYGAGYNLELVYAFLCFRLSIPLTIGLDFNHEQRTVTLPLGTCAILNNTREGTQPTIGDHPVLKM